MYDYLSRFENGEMTLEYSHVLVEIHPTLAAQSMTIDEIFKVTNKCR